MFQQLAQNPEFRLKIADRIHKYYFNNGLLTPAQSDARFRFRMAQLDRAVVGESARWGDSIPARTNNPFTRADFLNELGRLTNTYLPQRSAVVCTI